MFLELSNEKQKGKHNALKMSLYQLNTLSLLKFLATFSKLHCNGLTWFVDEFKASTSPRATRRVFELLNIS